MALKWLLNSAILTQFSGGMDTVAVQKGSDVVACPNVQGQMLKDRKGEYPNGFQVPLHYPKYSKADYEKMEEWRLDLLLHQYGLSFKGTLDEKRAFAIGAFLWPHQI
ncbi:uncharacterized protein [Euphorbia lathyris]|uniref:uncharacterized protein n=1 Tax=Euphorbia lathyris TaxID=212925 RepID=UPI0033142C0B